MARPVIAVPARFAGGAEGMRGRVAAGSRALLTAVYAAGGDPVLVLPVARGGRVTEEEVAERLRFAHGILLPGGGDPAGHWSGQPEHPTLTDVDPDLDAFELAAARHAVAAGMPLLGICRGAQMLAVALGGTLIQDLATEPVAGLIVGDHRRRAHRVRTVEGTLAAEILGETVEVSCRHHQAVRHPGEGVQVGAHAEDGVIEALEMPAAPGWVFATQWHPEDAWDTQPRQRAVFAAFVAAVRAG